jgi:vacuolar-type H+-ATPase subunit E/Vma4
VEILEKMLQIEVEAKQIVENAKLEANQIREKARVEAAQFVVDGKKNFRERLHQEIARIEVEAETHKKAILQETDARVTEMEQVAGERMEKVVEQVMHALLDHILAQYK